jgi:hypothetical protein
MKNIIITVFLVGFFLNVATAQEHYAQLDTTDLNRKPVFEVNKGFFKDVKMIANTRFALNNSFTNGNFQESKFATNEFRMEIVGKVSEKIKFRFRDVYTGNPNPGSQDLLRKGIDIAYVELEVSPTVNIAAGKLPPEWGSYEFDMNPIYIYAYNNMVQYSELFLSGVKTSWKANKNHNFSIQVVNSSTSSLNETYGNSIPNITKAKAALGTTLNWRGSFAEGKFSTMWSYTNINEAKNKQVSLLALGNQYKSKNLTVQYDFKLSNEDLDKTGMVSRIVQNYNSNIRALDVRYSEHWIRGEYFITPKWSTTLVGMISNHNWSDNNIVNTTTVSKNDRLSTSKGFTAALEFHPLQMQHVKIFATYVGRSTNYTEYAKQQFNVSNFNTSQILIGILSPLVLF